MSLARASFLLPLALLGLLAALFLTVRPLDYLTRGAPPAEALGVERATLDSAGIHLRVRAGSATAMSIAQVQVDGAYWAFSQTPPGPLAYLGSARLDIPYPWVAGETHHIVVVTGTGVTFEHTIDVAVATPHSGSRDLLGLALVGLMVGVAPILIGYAFYPAMMSFGAAGRQFALALTIGLLAFLFVDTLSEGVEAADKAVAGQKAHLALWLGGALSFLALLAIGRRSGRPPEGIALALFIAIGIGLHNFGEGLAIGASFATGAVALASFLVLGFALHNVTEGVAIAAPIARADMGAPLLAGLALIAGAPAIAGTVAGAFAYAPFWVALSFGIGAGAILQVIVEVGASLMRHGAGEREWFTPASLTGFCSGVALMYATALLVVG